MLNIEQNTFNTQYFSNQNVNLIQTQLVNLVRQRTGYIIGKQNCTSIVQAMQYFYVNYPQYTIGENIADNLQSLTNFVINDLLIQIISNVNQYVFYRKNLGKLSEPLEYGTSTGIKGKNTLELNQPNII